jgi:hypothetical protein
MKVIIDTDDLCVDEKGETLRSLVFDEKLIKNKNGDYRETGCYSTFDTRDGFVEIDPQKYPNIYEKIKPYEDSWFESSNPIKVTAFESEDIVAMWWWDGDGDLALWIKGEPYFYQNTDCKCSYDWYEIPIL